MSIIRTLLAARKEIVMDTVQPGPVLSLHSQKVIPLPQSSHSMRPLRGLSSAISFPPTSRSQHGAFFISQRKRPFGYLSCSVRQNPSPFLRRSRVLAAPSFFSPSPTSSWESNLRRDRMKATRARKNSACGTSGTSGLSPSPRLSKPLPLLPHCQLHPTPALPQRSCFAGFSP